MKKPLMLLAFLSALLMVAQVAGQPVPDDPAPVTSVDSSAALSQPAGGIKPDEPPTSEEVSEQVGKIQTEWERLGWMGGVAAIVGLLIMLLRIKPLNDWLEKKDWKKYKAIAAGALGAIGSFFLAWGESGILWPVAVIALIMGLISGWATVGLHQSLTAGNSK